MPKNIIVSKMSIVPGSLKKVNNPTSYDKSKDFTFYVKIDDIATNIPMDTNPRDQNLNSNVALSIRDSLESNDGNFHKKNRGLLISASGLNYNKNKNEITLYFDNLTQHGDIDGGHTYTIIKEHIGKNLTQYVRIEVMTGVEDIIEQLAEARNNSVQVDDKSMAELQNKFDPIKEGIEGMPFFSRIAFRQNQVAYSHDDKKRRLKMIDAREIVAIIMMFNPNLYDESHQPTQAYSSKAVMLRKYLKESKLYRRFTNIMPDIFELYDIIENDFPDAYNTIGGKYGRKKYSGYDNGNVISYSKFLNRPMTYRVPDGLIYPIIGAFRTLVVYNKETDKYEWKCNPFDIWDSLKKPIVNAVMNYSNTIGDNPNKSGKDSNIWQLAYMYVKMNQMKNDRKIKNEL